jgi:hypothetical protein
MVKEAAQELEHTLAGNEYRMLENSKEDKKDIQTRCE